MNSDDDQSPDERSPQGPERRPGRGGKPPDATGIEAADLRALVDSGARVTVLLNSGERLRGRIRYYDRDCFSLGPEGGGPKIFLRKASVRYLFEES